MFESDPPVDDVTSRAAPVPCELVSAAGSAYDSVSVSESSESNTTGRGPSVASFTPGPTSSGTGGICGVLGRRAPAAGAALACPVLGCRVPGAATTSPLPVHVALGGGVDRLDVAVAAVDARPARSRVWMGAGGTGACTVPSVSESPSLSASLLPVSLADAHLS